MVQQVSSLLLLPACMCRLCSGHQMLAVLFVHLADVVRYMLSFYNTCERRTRTWAIFGLGGCHLAANFGLREPIFALDQIFS